MRFNLGRLAPFLAPLILAAVILISSMGLISFRLSAWGPLLVLMCGVPLYRLLSLLPSEYRKGKDLERLAWKPSRIATDVSGIALTASEGSIALPWSEVAGWYAVPEFALAILYTRSGNNVGVNFAGFPGRDMKELSSLIQERAHLTSHGGRLRWLNPQSCCYMREGCRLLPGGRLDINSPPPLRDGH